MNYYKSHIRLRMGGYECWKAVLGLAFVLGISGSAPLLSQTPVPVQTSTPGLTVFTETPNLNNLYAATQDAYLAAHQISAADYAEVANALGPDFVAEIYSLEMTRLLGMIGKNAADRTPTETATLKEFAELLRQTELAIYTPAVHDYNLWKADPCSFKLDSDVASQYGLTYSGVQWCNQGLVTFLMPLSTPSADYYLAVARKKVFSKSGATPIATAALRNLASQYGWARQVPTQVAASASWAVAANNVDLARYANRSANLVRFGIAAAEGGLSTVEGFSLASAAYALGPAAIVEVMAQIAVYATIELVTAEQHQASVDAMISTANSLATTAPNLSDYTGTQSGLQDLTSTLATTTAPPGQALPQDQSFVFYIHGQRDAAELAVSLTTTDPSGSTQWITQLRKSWLQRDSPKAGLHELTTYLEYTGWDGTTYRADREGANWLVQKLNPADSDVACPAGVPITSACLSFTTTALQVKDDVSGNVLVEIVHAPSIDCCSSVVVSPGTPVNFTPSITRTAVCQIYLNGNLPAGLNVSSQDGSITGIAAEGTEGAYGLTYEVDCPYSAPVVSPFGLGVSTAVTFNNLPSSITVTPEIPVNIPFTISGNPVPNVASGNNFRLYGLTVNAQRGKGLISGIPVPNGLSCAPSPFAGPPRPGFPGCNEVAASNGILDIRQTVIITESFNPPAKFLAGQSSYTFRAGVPTSYIVRTSGAVSPVSITRTDHNLSAVQFQDNGNGTATLTFGGPTRYLDFLTNSTSFSLWAHALGAFDAGTLQPLADTLNVSLAVDRTVFFPAVKPPVYRVGQLVQDTIHTNYTDVGVLVDSALPAGLTMHGNTITGAPTPGSGGYYNLAMHAFYIIGSNLASATYPVEVYEAPMFMARPSYQAYNSLGAVFAINATRGYPTRKSDTSPGMSWTAQFAGGAPPPGISSWDNVKGVRNGFLTIQVDAKAPVGRYTYNIRAQNESGEFSQPVTINVVQLGDVNGDGHVTCADFSLVKAGLGAVLGSTNWDYRLDLDGNGRIDGNDLAIVNRLAGGCN